MALQATMRKFEIALANADAEIYETIELRVAQHPSENERFLVARVLARVLEHGEGLEFSKGGVSDDSEPAITQRNLRGEITAWIEVGSPSPDRLHKAAKASPRVAVYTWKPGLRAAIDERGVHRGDEIAIHEIPQTFLDDVAKTVERTNRWDISVTGGVIYLTVGDQLFTW
ncbi:MAG: YaeQ family protein [Kofleriaceae bacterium]